MTKEKQRAYNRKYYRAHRSEHKTSQQRWNLANPEKSRAYGLRKYGLTTQRFDEILAAQGGACAICGTSEWSQFGPVVDHDHTTGLVRGILCQRCNVALGMTGDDPERIKKILAYAQAHGR